MTRPKLNLTEFVVQDCVDHALVKDKKTGVEHRIDCGDALFLRCIDGSKDIPSIRSEMSELLCYEVSNETIFKALDTLSDIGILEHRVAPPASGQVTSRRRFLKNFSATAAAGAAVLPQVGFGQQAEQASKEESSKEQQEKLKSQEQQQKMSAEQNSKEQQQKSSAEISSKEAAVKSSGGGIANVPEPGFATLLGLGLGSMALLRRRNLRSKAGETEPGEERHKKD